MDAERGRSSPGIRCGDGPMRRVPSSCEWCDFTSVCGPRPLLELRRRYKLSDKRVQSVLRLRDVS